MNRSIDELWSEMKLDDKNSAYQLYDPSHPLLFYIGRDIKGQRLLHFVSKGKPIPQKHLKNIDCDVYDRGGEWSLTLTLKNSELNSKFTMLCLDLIESSRFIGKDSKSSDFVLGQLNKWRLLMQDSNLDELTEEASRGLYAELKYLESKLSNNTLTQSKKIIECWVGPYKADQDFSFESLLVEIKSVRSRSEKILISSERQLNNKEKELHLVVYTLENLSSGESVDLLVNKLRTALLLDFEALSMFEERILKAGYNHSSYFSSQGYDVINKISFLVTDEFPRLIPSSIPEGIFNASYEIKLEKMKAFIFREDVK